MKTRTRLFGLLVPIAAVLIALVVGGIVIACMGRDPLRGFAMLLYGSLGSPQKIAQPLVTACPLIFTSLAASFAYKCGVFNLGGEASLLWAPSRRVSFAH